MKLNINVGYDGNTQKTRKGNCTFMTCSGEHHPCKYYGGDAQPMPPSCHS